MDVFVNAIEGYPIQSGIILISLSIICLLFRLNNERKTGYEKRNILGKVSVIDSWGVIVFLLIMGIILILKNT